MKEIEDRLRELGARMETGEPDANLAAATLRRIRRRRRGNLVGGGVMVSFLGAAAVGGVLNLMPVAPQPPSARTSAQPNVDETTSSEPAAPSHGLSLEGFGAVWPEDTAQETLEACMTAAPFRAAPTATALEFGRAVLGWDAEAAAYNERADSVEVELTPKGTGGVVLTLVEYVQGCWSVQSVRATGEHTNLVSDRDVEEDGTSTISIDFDPPEGTSGTIELGYGPYLETKEWVAAAGIKEPVTFRLDPVAPRDGGHFLILFEDEAGRVVGAVGAALPPAQLRD